MYRSSITVFFLSRPKVRKMSARIIGPTACALAALALVTLIFVGQNCKPWHKFMMVWSFQAKIRLGVHMLGTYDIECYLWSVQHIFHHVEQPCYPAAGVQKLCVSPQKKTGMMIPTGLKYTL